MGWLCGIKKYLLHDELMSGLKIADFDFTFYFGFSLKYSDREKEKVLCIHIFLCLFSMCTSRDEVQEHSRGKREKQLLRIR